MSPTKACKSTMMKNKEAGLGPSLLDEVFDLWKTKYSLFLRGIQRLLVGFKKGSNSELIQNTELCGEAGADIFS